jgi:hypothetical protein
MPIAALVLGIIGLALSLTPYLFWVGLPVAAIALTLALVARRRGVPSPLAGIARAALILGAVGMVAGGAAATTCAIVKSPEHLKRMVRGTPQLEVLPEAHTDTDVDTDDDGDDEAAQPPVAIGEPVTFDGDSMWTVTAARVLGKKLVDETGDAMTTDGRFVEVRLRVKLLQTEVHHLDHLYALPTITDHDASDSIEPLEDTARFLPRGKKSAVGALLRPQQTQELTLIYDVPASMTDLRLELTSLDDSSPRLVELGL